MSIFLNAIHFFIKYHPNSVVLTSQNRLVSTLCHSCSRPQLGHYQKYVIPRPTNIRQPTAIFGTRLSISTRSSSPKRKSIVLYGLQLRKQSTTAVNNIVYSTSDNTSIDILDRQQKASTSSAINHYAKHGEPDQCLQYYLRLLESHGKLPNHEALHQLARILYIKQHLSGFTILHNTLLAYYRLHPPSGRQSRNLTYIYTMFINLIMRQPKNAKKRSSKRLPGQSSASSALPSPTLPRMTMKKKTEMIVQLCQEMRELGLAGSSVLYNSLLKFCVMKRDPALARSLYKELVMICPPTNYTYNILLDLARQQNDSSLVLQVLDRLELDGIVPDRPMVSSVMLALCDQKQYMVAVDFVDQLSRNAPQIIGQKYKAVLMGTLNRHYQQYQYIRNHNCQQYPQQQNKHTTHDNNNHSLSPLPS